MAIALLATGATATAGGRGLQVGVAAALVLALGDIGRDTSRLLIPRLTGVQRAVTAFTLAVAVATMLATALGHLGLLRREPFFLLVAGALLATTLAAYRRRVGRWRRTTTEMQCGATRRATPDPTATIDTPPGEAVVADAPPEGAGARAPASRGGGERAAIELPPDRLADLPRGAWALAERSLLGAGLAVLAALWLRETIALFDVPPGRGPDDLSYHLSAIAVWSRHADLRMIKFAMGDWSTAFYPILSDLCSWILLAPFGDDDVLARWSALPFALASLAAVAAVALRLGLSPRSAGVAVLAYAVVPRVPALAFTAGNDHATAFFALAAVDAAVAAGRRPCGGRLVYLGVAVGALVATKYIGIYYAAAALAVFAAAMLARRPRLFPPLRGLLLLVGAAVLVGGYTYARNAATAGNPVYPQPVALLGVELPGAAEASLAARLQHDEAKIEVLPFLARRTDLLGGLFAWALLPAALLAPLVALGRRPRHHALVLALPVLFFLQFLYLMYDHRDVRYFLAGIALAAVALAWLLERLGPRWGATLRLAVLVAILAALVGSVEARGVLQLGAALGAVALGLAGSTAAAAGSFRRAPASVRGWAPFGITLALAAAVSAGLPAYQQARSSGSASAAWLDELVGARGTTVAYAGLNAPYLYFGRRLQNDVRIVPRDRRLDAEYYAWGGTPELPYREGSYRDWRWALDELGVRYVVVVDGPEAVPERRWLRDHARFERVYGDASSEIWRVHPTPLEGRWREGRAREAPALPPPAPEPPSRAPPSREPPPKSQ